MGNRAEINSRAQQINGGAMSHGVRVQPLVFEGSVLLRRLREVFFQDQTDAESGQPCATIQPGSRAAQIDQQQEVGQRVVRIPLPQPPGRKLYCASDNQPVSAVQRLDRAGWRHGVCARSLPVHRRQRIQLPAAILPHSLPLTLASWRTFRENS